MTPETTKTWQTFTEADCPECGNDVEVETVCLTAGHCYDGDSARCVECSARGCISVDEDGDAHVIWNDEPAPQAGKGAG